VNFGLFTIDPTTGVVSGPIIPAFLDQQPVWSPDGTRIAFASLRAMDGFDNRIYVMNADGSGITNLTPTTDGNTCPTWSPDGTRIAYSDGNADIVIIPGGGGAPIATFAVDTCELSWSPLGDVIAFDDNATGGISVVNVTTGVVTNLTVGTDDAEPNWSPDGARLVFVRAASTNASQIFVMNSDGSSPAPLTSGSDDATPAWSPDGTRIVFSRLDANAGTSFLFLVAPTGGVPDPLTTSTTFDTQPDWQPIPRVVTPVVVAPRFTG